MGSGASKRITCPTCSKGGFTNHEFVKHFRESHNKQCTKCGLTGFETDDAMLQHYDNAHNTGSSNITCRQCSKNFAYEKDFIQHIRMVHSFEESQISFRDDRNSVCPECGKKKKNEEKLLKHLKKNHEFECDNCEKLFKTKADYKQHQNKEHSSMLKCPIKCVEVFSDVDGFMEHLSSTHHFAFVVGKPGNGNAETKHEVLCPDCKTKVDIDGIVEHIKELHIDDLRDANNNKSISIICPHCAEDTSDEEFESAADLLEHMKSVHSFSSSNKNSTKISNRSVDKNKSLPKAGDRILSMWEVSMWQYFHAVIKRKLPGGLKYEIDWDDGDTTGRFVDYHNIAIDRHPAESEIGIGSVVLFPQGDYTAGSTQLTGGKRWHQGRITDVTTGEDGRKSYTGAHTKGRDDGKMMNYRGFSEQFVQLRLEDMRVGPNVYDLLEDDESEDEDENTEIGVNDVDVYFSFCSDIKTIEGSCAPDEIVTDLRSSGINLVESQQMDKQDDFDQVKMMKNANMLMKKAKVFVACISDDYVQSETCRMEFQFAKSTLKKPVIPLVFGGQQWHLSVVGMLISGELYIDLKDKTVKDSKVESILQSISTHLGGDVTDSGKKSDTNPNKFSGPADIFVSYCWSNSNLALKSNHIKKLSGSEFADPREIKGKLTEAGYKSWLDIDQLKSGDQGVGMFEQLASALKNCKMVVACISDEYANSVNCRMEFQFACKTLGKPILPLIVGTGNNWEETVVGMLVKMNSQFQPIDLRELNTESDFSSCTSKILESVKQLLEVGSPADNKAKRKSRKPKIGDDVISLHCRHNYYTATVDNYNASTMEYTVDWDDGDMSGRKQKYNQVAINEVPEAEDVGVDSIIFFSQGSYRFDGRICKRYHEGVVTRIHKGPNGNALIDGQHTKGESDGKTISYSKYSFEFKDIPLEDVRIAPSALDTMV